jgi:protein-glutamine gamma-glutamyltransferase
MPRAEASASVSVERFLQFCLLGLVASGFLALAASGYIDTPTIALTSAALLVRALMAAGIVTLDFSDRSVAFTTAAYAGFFLVDFFLLSRGLLPCAVHLAFFLAILKTLTARTDRDYAYLAAIAALELVAAALLSIDLQFFLALSLYLPFGIGALTSAEIRRSIQRAGGAAARGGLRRFHPRLAFLAASISLGIFALTAGLFFVLPRTAGAALSRFARHSYLPGFTQEVTLGRIGSIKRRSTPVMHVREVSGPGLSGVKWRGAALDDFDGHRWSNTDLRRTRIPVQYGHADLGAGDWRGGNRIEYHVDYDALDATTLFLAGAPEKIDVAAPYLVRTPEGAYSIESRPGGNFHYQAYAALERTPGASPQLLPTPVLPLRERDRYLQLPPRLDARVPALARSMADRAASELEKAKAIENSLRSDYGYTLDLPKREVADPLANFLFTRREGHCEYFASAMAVLLRTLDIPTRVVTGFQPGQYNPVTSLWVVRASDAHSWVEAWMPGYGWSTFDPTPPDPGAPSFGLLTQLGLYLDAADTFWQDWVLGYDMNRQGSLSERVERSALRTGMGWVDALSGRLPGLRVRLARVGAKALAPVAGVAAACLCLWLLAPAVIRRVHVRRRVERARRGEAGQGDATLLYHRMLRILKRRGYQKPAWYTPAEFARSLPAGGMGHTVAEFTAAYNDVRFGGRTAEARRMSALLDELERAAAGRGD